MKRSKGFVNILVVVIIVALAGVVGYLGFQQKEKSDAQRTDEVANNQTSDDLKTYANAKYGFSFNYLAKYTLTEKDVTEETANFIGQKVADTKAAYNIELKSADGLRISFQVNWAYGSMPTSTDKTVKETKNGVEVTKNYLKDIQGDLGRFINASFTVKGNQYLIQSFNSEKTEGDLDIVLNSLEFN